MSAQWLSHFRLSEAPFFKEITDENLWVPSSRQPVLDDLVEACSDRGHVMLTGEPGGGQNMRLAGAAPAAARGRISPNLLPQCNAWTARLYRQLCLALGLSPKSTAAGVFFEVSSHVQQLGQERMHPVFLLDESQLLHQDVLDHLHVLTNYE